MSMLFPKLTNLRLSAAFLAAILSVFIGPTNVNAQALASLKVPAAVYEFNADGTGWKKVFTPGDYVRIGSLRMSPDGTRLSFDGLKAGQAWSDASLLSCKLDGSDLQRHGQGAMPNFSPDGKRMSFCSYGDPYGVHVVTLADSSRRLFESGWGVQWSPQSDTIAFVRGGGTVVLSDLETGETRSLFPDGGSPYSSVHYNMAWSPDGKRLAIQGTKANGDREIAIVDAQGAEFSFKVAAPLAASSNFLAWHPSGKKLAYQSWVMGNKCSQLYVVDLETAVPPLLIAGQPLDFDNVSLCWTQDGRNMLVISWQRN